MIRLDLFGKKMLPHNNRLTVCPPGIITKQKTNKLILVPSVMRSGTHVLIDTIINNFSSFKTHPLYVDLDQLLAANDDLQKLLDTGGYIIKTHFPQTQFSEKKKILINKIIKKSYIISPTRNSHSIINSNMLFGVMENATTCKESIHLFEEFWAPQKRLVFPFEDLINPLKTKDIVSEISHYIDEKSDSRCASPIAKKYRYRIYLAKLFTRLLGKHCPYVNTTISFGKVR